MTHLLRALVIARAFVRAPHPTVFLVFVERVLGGGRVGGSSFLLHVSLIKEKRLSSTKRLLSTHRFPTTTYTEVTAGATDRVLYTPVLRSTQQIYTEA